MTLLQVGPPKLSLSSPAPSPPASTKSSPALIFSTNCIASSRSSSSPSPFIWGRLLCGLNGLVWSQHARVHDIHLTALHPDIFVFCDKHRASSYLIKSSSRCTWLPSSANFLFCPRPLHKLRSTAPCTPDPSSTILSNVSQTTFLSQRALSSGPWEDFKKSVMKVVGFSFTLWCLIVKVVRETKKDSEFSDSLIVISKHWD